MKTLRAALPNVAIFVLMVVCTLIIDAILHLSGRPEWGRQLGYLGTMLLVLSFAYSLRKRKWIKRGKPLRFLRAHEFLAWLGALLVLVHAGIHFNALLPWLATAAMLVAVASGLIGKYLLSQSKSIVSIHRSALLEQGLTSKEAEEHLHWDALAVEMMKKWRTVHMPVTWLFGFLALLHIATAILFWGW